MQDSALNVGLSAEQLASLFPFYFVINREFRFVQLGPSISKSFDAEINLNAYMDVYFEITTPTSLLNWGYLRSMANELCSVRHKKTQIDFSAKILPVEDDKLIFLLKPLLNSSTYMDFWGLKPSDFSNHDLVHDLFLHKKQTVAPSEINLSDVLITQQEQLREIRQLLANQEAESRKLAHIISRSTYWIVIANSMGRIEWVNDAFLKNSGYSQEDADSSDLSMLLDISLDEFQLVKKSLVAETNFHKVINVMVDNEPRWIDIDIRALFGDKDEIINFIAIGRDITIEKRTQLLNERLTAELNTIFDLSPDGFVSFAEDGRISQVNSAFLKMTGLAQEALIGVNADNFDELISSINEYKEQDKVPLDKADLIKISQPKLTIIRHSVKILTGIENNHKKSIHYFQDITHEFELSRMKGEFLSAAAHELRTPMASIFGFTDLLINRAYSESQTKEILQNIYRQATRMTKLINDLLNLSRIEAKGKLEFNPSNIQVNHLIDSALEEFKVNFKNRVINITHADREAVVKGDFDKLTQVLINLLSNANKYSDADKEIEIHTKSMIKDSVAFVGIKVTDFGAGISKSDLKKLFQPFFRSANTMKVPGTGLGMCIVKEIIDFHDGEIEVVSELDVGTQVTVWIPEAESASN